MNDTLSIPANVNEPFRLRKNDLVVYTKQKFEHYLCWKNSLLQGSRHDRLMIYPLWPIQSSSRALSAWYCSVKIPSFFRPCSQILSYNYSILVKLGFLVLIALADKYCTHEQYSASVKQAAQPTTNCYTYACRPGLPAKQPKLDTSSVPRQNSCVQRSFSYKFGESSAIVRLFIYHEKNYGRVFNNSIGHQKYYSSLRRVRGPPWLRWARKSWIHRRPIFHKSRLLFDLV